MKIRLSTKWSKNRVLQLCLMTGVYVQYLPCTADENGVVENKVISSKLPKSRMARRSNLPVKFKPADTGSSARCTEQSAIIQVIVNDYPMNFVVLTTLPQCTVYFKGKGLDTCYSATFMSQTCDHQRFTISEVAADGMSQWCHSALCGHPLPALTDSWTHGAASRHTITPISHTRHSPHSRSYYLFPVPLREGGCVGLSTQ